MDYEGSAATKLALVMKCAGYNEYDRIEFATVTSPPPALRIKVDGMKIELEPGDLVIAECLTDHARTVTIVADNVAATDSGGDTIAGISLAEAIMTVKSPLTTGDRVIVAQIKGGQTYVVLDRMVTY